MRMSEIGGLGKYWLGGVGGHVYLLVHLLYLLGHWFA